MRPTLRLAWREIIRHRWRSLLVTALIGLPVLASVSAATLLETGSVNGLEARPFTFGSAQAQVTYGFVGDNVDREPGQPRAQTVGQAESEIEAITGQSAVLATWGDTWVESGSRAWSTAALEADFASPLTEGLTQTVTGRLPRATGEAAISPHLRHLGVSVGDQINIGGSDHRVVGVARALRYGTDVPQDAVMVMPSDVQSDLINGSSTTFLAGAPGEPALTADQIKRLQSRGFSAYERGSAWGEDGYSPSSEDTNLIALLVTCLLIEIVLLAGPAFAVGVRRQQRTLALLAVAGGSPRDIRRTVLAQGVLLGLVSSALGAALAIPVTWLGLRAVERWFGLTLGPFDVGVIAIAPAIALGTVSALAASVIPARHAAKASVVTALAGRQPAPKVRAGWPLIGAAVLAVGTLGSVASAASSSGDTSNAWWAVVSVCGAVMMTPWLIAVVARAARRFPLPVRLALRDADRHRSRSAPAVAAVMASVSAVVALGIGGGSDARSNDRDQVYDYPLGAVTLSGVPAADLTATLTAIKARTGVTFTPLTRVDELSIYYPSANRPQHQQSVVIADPAILQGWGITLSPDAAAALASGQALTDQRLSAVHDAEWSSWTDDETPTPRTYPASFPTDLTLPGALPEGAERPAIAGAVISAEAAAALKLGSSEGSTVSTVALADVDAASIDLPALRSVIAKSSAPDTEVSVSEKERSEYWLLMTLLIGLGTFTVLVGTFSATGLALNDARPDMETLSAVGARPRSRRMVAGSHAFVIALLGVVLGIAVGFTPGVVASRLLTGNFGQGWILVIPWPLLGALLIVLPLVAGGVTALVSSTRIRITRRTA